MKKELQASQRLVLAVVLDAAVDHSEFGLFPHASKAANQMKSDLVSRLECCQRVCHQFMPVGFCDSISQ